MAAYLIAEIDVVDNSGYDEYRKQVGAIIAKHGGKFLVRGGAVEPKEGGWQPKRLVVVEFPSMEKARTFYHSADYAPLIALRQKASRGKLVLVEGA